MKNKTKYRILEYENRAGGKQYYPQVNCPIFFGLVSFWSCLYYYNSSQKLEVYDFGTLTFGIPYSEYCDAVNAIKYHKMFGKEKNRKYIHEIND